MTLAISFHLFFEHALQRTTETMKAICDVGRLLLLLFLQFLLFYSYPDQFLFFIF